MVLTDERRALLGDHEAARRLTDAGVLLPCPMCGKKPELLTWRNEKKRTNLFAVKCPKCRLQTRTYLRRKRALLAWNTRAPILSAEEMEMLEGME